MTDFSLVVGEPNRGAWYSALLRRKALSPSPFLLPLSFADRVSKSFLPYLRASAAPELTIQFPREDRYGCPRGTVSPMSENWGVGSKGVANADVPACIAKTRARIGDEYKSTCGCTTKLAMLVPGSDHSWAAGCGDSRHRGRKNPT